MRKVFLLFISLIFINSLNAQDLEPDETNSLQSLTEQLESNARKNKNETETDIDVIIETDKEVEVVIEEDFDKTARIDLGLGAAFYNDAIGINAGFCFQMSLGNWIGIFNKDHIPSLFAQRFLLGVGTTANIVPISFSVYSINMGLSLAYQIKLSDIAETQIPLSTYSYLLLGAPINSFSTGNDSIVSSGFSIDAGQKLGYQIGKHFEIGIGVEYQMNFTSIYIGSLAVYGYGSIIF